MPVIFRIGLCICMLLIAGLGIMLAVNRIYGMAFIFVLLCLANRPPIMDRVRYWRPRRSPGN